MPKMLRSEFINLVANSAGLAYPDDDPRKDRLIEWSKITTRTAYGEWSIDGCPDPLSAAGIAFRDTLVGTLPGEDGQVTEEDRAFYDAFDAAIRLRRPEDTKAGVLVMVDTMADNAVQAA